MKADAMNAFEGAGVAQDNNRNDDGKSDGEPVAFQEFCPFCDQRENSTAMVFDNQDRVNGDR